MLFGGGDYQRGILSVFWAILQKLYALESSFCMEPQRRACKCTPKQQPLAQLQAEADVSPYERIGRLHAGSNIQTINRRAIVFSEQQSSTIRNPTNHQNHLQTAPTRKTEPPQNLF
jgi:hypothetical protein